uniref:YabP/YqfC family sporulation protein n=1 Tax=Gemmiger qucibialis TaxID=2997294 RepID=UPI003FEDAF69
MKQHPRRRSKRRTPAPTLHESLRKPYAHFYTQPDLDIPSRHLVNDGCRPVLDFAPQKITLDVGSTVITFYGTALRIESLNGKRLTVAGRVARIDFAPKWEVDANEAPHSGSR